MDVERNKRAAEILNEVCAQLSIASVFLTPRFTNIFDSCWFMSQNVLIYWFPTEKIQTTPRHDPLHIHRWPPHHDAGQSEPASEEWCEFIATLMANSAGRSLSLLWSTAHVMPTLIAFLPCRSSTRRVWRRSIRSTLCILMCLSSSKPSAMPITSAT